MKLIPENKSEIRILDLTENNFNGLDMRFLSEFPNLKTLILDKNQIESKFLLPLMPSLETLWVNHNQIDNLSVFIKYLKEACGDLKYLSMLNNKAAPSYFNGGTVNEYNDYRLYVISKLTKLQILDSKEVSAEERMQAQSVYGTELRTKRNSIRKSSIQTRRRSTLKPQQLEQSKSKLNESNEIVQQPVSQLNFLPNLEATNEHDDNERVKPPELTDNVLETLNSKNDNSSKISQLNLPPPPPIPALPPSPPPFLLPPPSPPPQLD